MPNRAYQKGRRFEYRVKDYLIKKGYFVMRSAGSKGVADLVVIKPYFNHSKVFLVQAKSGRGSINKQEIVTLTQVASKINAVPVLVKVDESRRLLFIDLNTTLEIELCALLYNV